MVAFSIYCITYVESVANYSRCIELFLPVFCIRKAYRILFHINFFCNKLFII